jgi:hypothetical protein
MQVNTAAGLAVPGAQPITLYERVTEILNCWRNKDGIDRRALTLGLVDQSKQRSASLSRSILKHLFEDSIRI